MKINLIIGAGQLGSRHLQGLLRLDISQEIYVLDPSDNSLQIAIDRANEIENRHNVKYISDWTSLPANLDLVIVATGANVRKNVVLTLLENYDVKYLVLEKVLFQDLSSYEQVGKKIADTNTKVWVNHPRRMFDHYKVIRDVLKTQDEKISFQVIGYNWGLGCNGLHLVDLCAYLAGSSVSNLDSEWIDDILLESKRVGYVEFTGTLKGSMEDGSSFLISSLKSDAISLSIVISTKDKNWIIEEGAKTCVLYHDLKITKNSSRNYYVTEFQSSLTTTLAQQIFSTGMCDLPTYFDACRSHEPFIAALLEKYNNITNIKSEICPIT